MQIDATTLDAAQRCFRYYQYRIVDGWVPREPSPHLAFGGYYADALEQYYIRRAAGDDLDTALLHAVRHAMRESWGWDSMHNAKTRENLIRTLVWYVDQFAADELQVVILPDGKPATEYIFALDLDGGHTYCGKLDRVVQTRGDIYISDQKTTAQTISPRYFEQYSPDNQMSGYTFVGKAIFDLPIKGVIIDAAQIAVGFSRFERGFAFRTDSQLEEWYKNTLAWIDMIQAVEDEGIYPMNTQACDKWGGCPFRGVCARSPEVRDVFLRADFVKKPWTPPGSVSEAA